MVNFNVLGMNQNFSKVNWEMNLRNVIKKHQQGTQMLLLTGFLLTCSHTMLYQKRVSSI